jgi:hypothetical protein
MSYYESSDYCGCTLGDISFYYGYEVEQDGEWCFCADINIGHKNSKEIARYKSSELTNNKFELAPNLFAGINKMFKDGLIKINVVGNKFVYFNGYGVV